MTELRRPTAIDGDPPPPQTFQLLAEYNAWTNGQIYAVCAEIPDAERRRDSPPETLRERGAFFRSIHGTLNHLLFGDLAWLGRFWGETLVTCAIGEDLYDDFDDLWRSRRETDDRLQAWTATLDRDWLAAPFTYHSTAYRKTRVLPAWVLVLHLFNHQTHHRGQLTVLLSQLGYDFGITDLPWMPALEGLVEPDRPFSP